MTHCFQSATRIFSYFDRGPIWRNRRDQNQSCFPRSLCANSVRRDSPGRRRIKIANTIDSPSTCRRKTCREGRRWKGENMTSRRYLDGTYYMRTYVETRRCTSLSSLAASAGPSSANGITLTQWHSDYIIAGFSSRAVRSRSLRVGSRERAARPTLPYIRVRSLISLLLASTFVP